MIITVMKSICGPSESYSISCLTWSFPSVIVYLNVGLNPHMTLDQKKDELMKQAHNFSYAEAVKKSKKKLQ